MGRIRVLEPHVVNQIAAGEVIERPASVVKELVENALDAGARRVEVEVRDGGLGFVQVADDGWGMGPEDLAKAFRPHTTSKIATVEDLRHVASLGFRGEALASIGSVSRARIASRPADAEAGWCVENVEGAIGDVEPVAAAPGTVVRVEGLFAHVPARRRFLRSPGTELGHVLSAMGRFAVAWPEVAFRLVQGPRTLLDVPGPQPRGERIAAVHGRDVGEALIRVEEESGDLTLEGRVGPPSLHRADGRLEQTFLNGRFVRDRTVQHALRQAYDGLLPPGGRRPVAFLFLLCDPARVDVNVHPTKAEVRWRESAPVHGLVARGVRAALEASPPGVEVPVARDVPTSTREAVEWAFTHGTGRSAPTAPPPSAGVPPGADTLADVVARPAGEPDAPPDGVAEGMRFVGQALRTYLVLDATDALVIVDQHALHERVLYDRIRSRLDRQGALEVQRLLVPAVVHLDPALAAVAGEQAEVLETLGWHVEAFGDDAVAVSGLPAVLRRPDPEAVLLEVLRALGEGGRNGLDRSALIRETVERMACRAAVMAGDRLEEAEVVELLEQARTLEHAHTCPHGRPTQLVLRRRDLERWFHRSA